MYDTQNEWEEKRDKLIEVMTDAVRSKRDSVLWLRLMTSQLTYWNINEIVEKLGLRYINQYLFPVLEAEADLSPSGKLMKWYVAMLDRSDQYEQQTFNRLAYFYLWYGSWECDEEKAKNFFLAMERRGIAPKNPYKGTFGERGHDEMIRKLLNGTLDEDRFHILTGYAREQIRYIEENGVTGDVEGSREEVGNLRFAWIEDHQARDLRETMQRLHEIVSDDPSEENMIESDAVLKIYGSALKRMIEKAKKDPGQIHIGKGIVFMLAMLHDHDNWLLRIIDLEACDGRMLQSPGNTEEDSGSDEAAYYRCMQEWLIGVEAFCGKGFIIGEELMVLNSLYENLINHYEKKGENGKSRDLLEKHVYTTDGMMTLSRLVEWLGLKYYGAPYKTHNAMALLQKYAEAGAREKAIKLVRDIEETDAGLPDYAFEDHYSYSLKILRQKYEFLLEKLGLEDCALDARCDEDEDKCREYYFKGEYEKALEVCEKTDVKRHQFLEYVAFGKLPEGVEPLTLNGTLNSGGKTARSMSCMGGVMTAMEMTPVEQRDFYLGMKDMEERFQEDITAEKPRVYPRDSYCLKYTFRPAPAASRGDFLRYLYSNPGDKDWFGRTKEEWEETIIEITQNMENELIQKN